MKINPRYNPLKKEFWLDRIQIDFIALIVLFFFCMLVGAILEYIIRG
jgi:hypothetical protein